MTDHPRFQMIESAADDRHREYHGAPQVELLFRLVDWWLGHKRRMPVQSASGQQAVVEQHSSSTLQLG